MTTYRYKEVGNKFGGIDADKCFMEHHPLCTNSWLLEFLLDSGFIIRFPQNPFIITSPASQQVFPACPNKNS